MSLFSREAIREWAVARAAAKKVETVDIWDATVDVAEAVQSTPEMALAAALFYRYQNTLPDYSANDARAELANIAWHGTGKGYVQMSMDELLDEVLADIAKDREDGLTFLGDDLSEADFNTEGLGDDELAELCDYTSVNEFLTGVREGREGQEPLC